MRVLAIERQIPGVKQDAFGIHMKAEAARVWELCQADILRQVFFRQDRREAVLLLECADAAKAAEVLGTLPLVEAGLITFEIIPLVPYPGLARLFAAGICPRSYVP